MKIPEERYTDAFGIICPGGNEDSYAIPLTSHELNLVVAALARTAVMYRESGAFAALAEEVDRLREKLWNALAELEAE